jgi:hypothetical protein
MTVIAVDPDNILPYSRQLIQHQPAAEIPGCSSWRARRVRR